MSKQTAITYLPEQKAMKVLDTSLSSGWAVSYNEAINKALAFWHDWQTGEFEHDGEQ